MSKSFPSIVPSFLPKQDAAAPFGLYIHIPFCEKKCPYCDFNTYAKLDTYFDAYVDALCLELRQWGERLNHRRVDTVFLGGGTPTVLDARALTQIFETVRTTFSLTPDCEITSEANPGTVDQRKFAVLHDLGVNRLSMGVQSFQPQELEFLGRIHSVEDVYRAFDMARQVGFNNINLDFIFGLPHQSPAAWSDTLERVTALAPDHLSLYSLIVEPNTPLFHWVEAGEVAAPDDDHAGMLYEMALAHMAESGYVHYEVSNWAKTGASATEDQASVAMTEPTVPALACRHNLIYWRNQAFLGVGPGAHSYLHAGWLDDGLQEGVGLRWSNRKPVPGYIKRINAAESVQEFQESIDVATSMGETMMLGLRLVQEGVERAPFLARYGVDVVDVYPAQVDRFVTMNMMTVDAQRLRLTPRGLMVGNQIFAAFLP